MQYYSTFQEKSDYFLSGGKTIDNFQALVVLIEKLNNSNSDNQLLFRGQPEAKYKLYCSLQRLWQEKKLHNHYGKYSELINNLISNCKDWNGGLINKYLKYLKSDENKMSYLSIMQHYGLPTPLLDFTLDINKSLFFAIENIDYSPANTEIENYFSIYYVFKKNTILNTSDFFINKTIEYAKKNDLIKSKNLETVLQFEIVLIDNTDEEYRIQNNLNILNQDGAFIFNSSPTEPLESQYLSMRELLYKFFNKKIPDIQFSKELGGCININKKLVGQIVEYLKSKGIDRNSIYPDLNNLKSDCLNLEWKNICT